MKLDRRKLFALGGLGALGAGTAQAGPELNLDGGGITIKIAKRHGEWMVLVPDWEADWHPGYMVQVKWMPLADYLAMFDRPAS